METLSMECYLLYGTCIEVFVWILVVPFPGFS